MDSVVITYLVYLAVGIVLTAGVGRVLYRNGRVFLADVFPDNPALADAVNNLLRVGFYLINVGYVALSVRVSVDGSTAATAVASVSVKIGGVLLVLGVLHVFNVGMLNRFRKRAHLQRKYPAPRGEAIAASAL